MKILILLLSVISINCFGQYYTSSYNSIHFQNRSYGFITQLPPAPPGTRGDSYLHQEFLVADVFLKDSTALIDIKIKLDMKANRVEIDHNQQVKLLPFDNVVKIVLGKNAETEEYVSPSVLKFPEANYHGLVRIHSAGTVMLVSAVKAEILRANYNVALDVGRKDNEILLKSVYFIFQNDNWIEVGSSRRTFRKQIVNTYGEAADKFVEEVNIKNESELISLVEHLNKIVKS